MKKSIPLIILTILISVLNVKSQEVNRFFPEKDLITTGIYYYPEHWKESQWERDIKKISDMGYEFVHLAEFAWFKMEPEEGKFDFSGKTHSQRDLIHFLDLVEESGLYFSARVGKPLRHPPPLTPACAASPASSAPCPA